MTVDDSMALIRRLVAALSTGRSDVRLELGVDERVCNGQRITPRLLLQVRILATPEQSGA